MFLLAMLWGGNKYAWDSSITIGLFVGAFATAVVFVLWEHRRGEKAMIPPHFARNPLVVFGCCTSALQNGAMVLLSYYLPLWFQVVKDVSPTTSGVDVLPTAIAQSISAILAGRFGKCNVSFYQLCANNSLYSPSRRILHSLGNIWQLGDLDWQWFAHYIDEVF